MFAFDNDKGERETEITIVITEPNKNRWFGFIFF